MHYLKRMTGKKGEDAVSPVVGVMLMLVVTLIIAAVVSAFAGGLVSGTKKTPSLTMDVTITNSGAFASSQFNAKVLSVSEGIPTRNLKLITSWTNTSGFKGGANVTATSNVFGWSGAGFPLTGTAPWGFGPGIASPNSGKPGNLQQQFGNYTLLEGTIMNAYPAANPVDILVLHQPAADMVLTVMPTTIPVGHIHRVAMWMGCRPSLAKDGKVCGPVTP